MHGFEIAAGSVLGRDHALAGRNNQDAWRVWRGPEAVLAVVCDGCGSGRFSETGAQAGSRMTVEALRRRLPSLDREGPQAVLEAVRLDLLEELARLARALDGTADAIGQHLLFTILGAAITPELSLVFALGDGVLAVNGEVDVLTSPNNAPAYLAYALSGLSDPRFDLRRVLPTRHLSSLLIGTDGACGLLAPASDPLPERCSELGPLQRLSEDERVFANPATLTRRLALMNRPIQRIDWDRRRVEREVGRLHDDTTLVLMRRRRGGP